MLSKTILTLLVTAFSFTALFTSCSDDTIGREKEKYQKVYVEKVRKISLPQIYEFSGNVEGLQQVKLSTKLMGEIIHMPYEAGTHIRKGQMLAKIRSTDLEAKKQQVLANLTQAEAGLRNMEINYNRVKNLYEKKSATQKEMDDITMAYDMAKAQVEAVKEMEKEIDDVLSYSEIIAPFDGYIVNKFFEEGDIAAPGHPLMIVENFNGFKVVAYVSASEVNRFSEGSNAKIKIDAFDNKTFYGKVSEINPGGNPASRQFMVQIELNKGQNTDMIKSGMYAKVILENSTRDILSINTGNLVKRGQLTGVYTVNDNNEASLRWIRPGKKFEDKIEVLAGLNAGDKVIKNYSDVKEGQKVEVL
jgi:RND family efflux transporter MFP subunit